MTELIASYGFTTCIFGGCAYMLIADILAFVFRNRQKPVLKRVITILGVCIALVLLIFVVMEFDKLAKLESITMVIIIIMVLGTGFFSGKVK